MNILGCRIDTVQVIDDDARVRQTLINSIDPLAVNVMEVDRPIRMNVDRFAQKVIRDSQAALCDHRLQGNYAGFDGGELVAQLYRHHFPAVLCTRWDTADADGVRRLRRYIPVVLGPYELDAEHIRDGFQRCIEEFKGEFREDRRPWRTLISIEEVINDERGSFFYFFAPIGSRTFASGCHSTIYRRTCATSTCFPTGYTLGPTSVPSVPRISSSSDGNRERDRNNR